MTTKATIDFTDHEAARIFFDDAWAHPRRKYLVTPADPEIARRWLRDNAYMLAFGWATESGFQARLKQLGPMQPNTVIPLDELSNMRNRCGWFVTERVDPIASHAAGEPVIDEDYLCEHPDNLDGCRPGQCFASQCPIAAEADREAIRKLYPELWRSDYKDHPNDEPHDWMVLWARPRYAYVPNVTVLGCEGWEGN